MTKLDIDNGYTKLLILLICTDVAFIGLHLVHLYTGHLSANVYSLGMDRGYAELFQYVKEYWLVILLCVLAFRGPTLIYSSWSLLFGYLLKDDCFTIHERFGSYAVRALSLKPMLGLRAQDFGELLVNGFAGTVLLILISIAYFRCGDREKAFSRYLATMLIALAFFGVFVDMIVIMVGCVNTGVAILLSTVEEGGEMLVVSVMLWFVFGHNSKSRTKTEDQCPT